MFFLRTPLAVRVAAFTLTWTLVCSIAGCGTPSLGPSDDHPTDIASLHDEGLLGNGLTRAEAQTVLKLIDDTCGDTWCEGDHAFRFRYLFCDFGSERCSLLFQMALRTDGESPLEWNWQRCRTSGFLGFDSLVHTSSNGYQWLTSAYYDALNDCIGGLTSRNDDR